MWPADPRGVYRHVAVIGVGQHLRRRSESVSSKISQFLLLPPVPGATVHALTSSLLPRVSPVTDLLSPRTVQYKVFTSPGRNGRGRGERESRPSSHFVYSVTEVRVLYSPEEVRVLPVTRPGIVSDSVFPLSD